jgi:hypothetical protein
MRETLRGSAIIVAGFGLIVLTSVLGAISITDRIRPSASMSEYAVAVPIVTVIAPR